MIRLSKLADYGIVIMTHLARPGHVQESAQEIALATRVPPAMASKILKSLARAGLLRSQRGVKGGYELARVPHAVSMAEIIEALDGPIALTDCVDGAHGDCTIESLCPARTNWDRINTAIRGALDSVSLDEMAGGIPTAFLTLDEQARAAAPRRVMAGP
ncbi:MAG: SUF system Fe-S cluster assembly regulator [Geminicoccaceae bacterium]